MEFLTGDTKHSSNTDNNINYLVTAKDVKDLNDYNQDNISDDSEEDFTFIQNAFQDILNLNSSQRQSGFLKMR